jgi:hypothetical protein
MSDAPRGIRIVRGESSRVDTNVDSADLGACAPRFGARFWSVPTLQAEQAVE